MVTVGERRRFIVSIQIEGSLVIHNKNPNVFGEIKIGENSLLFKFNLRNIEALSGVDFSSFIEKPNDIKKVVDLSIFGGSEAEEISLTNEETVLFLAILRRFLSTFSIVSMFSYPLVPLIKTESRLSLCRDGFQMLSQEKFGLKLEESAN